MKRFLLAVILGGVVLHLWGALAHEALPLGELGVRTLDSEQISAAIKADIKESGFYIFPMPDLHALPKEQQAQAMQQATEKMKAGPTGIMVVYPQGREFLMGPHLTIQGVTDLVTVLLAVTLLSWATRLRDYGARVGFVVLLGFFPTLCTEVPQWNWYGFPSIYTVAQLAMHLIGFLLAGLVVAGILKPRPAAA